MPAEHPARAWGKEGGRVTVFSACGGAVSRLRVLEQGRLFHPLHSAFSSAYPLSFPPFSFANTQSTKYITGKQGACWVSA